MILRYTFLLCRNFALRNVLKQEHEKAMQGEKQGILWELEAIKSGVNFLRKLAKTINRGRVGGWCDNVHLISTKNETYEEKREIIESLLKIYLDAIRKELYDCQLLNAQIFKEWAKLLILLLQSDELTGENDNLNGTFNSLFPKEAKKTNKE